MAHQTLKGRIRSGGRTTKQRTKPRRSDGTLVDSELLARAARTIHLRGGRRGLDMLPEK